MLILVGVMEKNLCELEKCICGVYVNLVTNDRSQEMKMWREINATGFFLMILCKKYPEYLIPPMCVR